MDGGDSVNTVRAGDYNFFYGKGSRNHQFGMGCFVHRRRVPAVETAEFVSDSVSAICSSERSMV